MTLANLIYGMLKEMFSQSILVRLAAVIMLLLVGTELVACEMIDPDHCELQGSQTQSSDDCCVCCCRHVSFIRNAEPVMEMGPSMDAYVPPAPVKPLTRATEIYHPPQNYSF